MVGGRAVRVVTSSGQVELDLEPEPGPSQEHVGLRVVEVRR